MLEVKRLRQAREWNQTELAYHAGLAPSVISQIENGKREPSARTLRKLAEALGVEVGDLFPKGQAPLPEMQEYEALLVEKGFPRKQIAAWLAQDERDEEFIARELEKMSEKEFREALLRTSPYLLKYYREAHKDKAHKDTNRPPESKSA